MKINRPNIFIYLFVAVFMVSLASPITINLQYGATSTFNEIEHTDTIPFTELNEEIKHKVKLCQDLFQFKILIQKFHLKGYLNLFEELKQQVNLSVITPPPEFVG